MWEVRAKLDESDSKGEAPNVTGDKPASKSTQQVPTWNDRWARKRSAEWSKLDGHRALYGNLSAARRLTEELEQEFAALRRILATGLERAPLRWADLKEENHFTAPRPNEPVPPRIPPKPPYPECPVKRAYPQNPVERAYPERPVKRASGPIPAAKPTYPDAPTKSTYPTAPDPLKFMPTFNLLDRNIEFFKVTKERRAAKRLRSANADWQKGCAAIDKRFEAAKASWEEACAAIDRKFESSKATWQESCHAIDREFESATSAWQEGCAAVDEMLKPAKVAWLEDCAKIDRVFDSAAAAWRETCAVIDESYKKRLATIEAAHNDELRKYREGVEVWKAAQRDSLGELERQHTQIDALRLDYRAGKASAVEYFFAEVLKCSTYPEGFPRGSTVNFIESSGILTVDFELPSQPAFPSIKEIKYIGTRQKFQEVQVSDAWLKKAYDDVLYQIALRTLHELYAADEGAALKSVVFNGWVHSIDKATGNETYGCILSVQASREEFLEINLSQVDPKACFRKLKGIASSKLIELTPVRPILTINKEDRRFVEGYAVAGALDDRTNLAAMDWLDFENLIRELFQEEFSKNGGEVKITQASRDGGVDAIAFDPDPIRGGKIVIQAKRYTNVVGVAAVRDLFGTVHNEGATKGILVTTSTYGADAYEFAKDKPLTLLSGGELLSLLGAHGHRAKIDLQEAKALSLQREQQTSPKS